MIRRAPHRELSLGRYAKKGQSRALSQGQEPHMGARKPASLYKDQTAEVLAYEVLALHDRMNKKLTELHDTLGPSWTEMDSNDTILEAVSIPISPVKGIHHERQAAIALSQDINKILTREGVGSFIADLRSRLPCHDLSLGLDMVSFKDEWDIVITNEAVSDICIPNHTPEGLEATISALLWLSSPEFSVSNAATWALAALLASSPAATATSAAGHGIDALVCLLCGEESNRLLPCTLAAAMLCLIELSRDSPARAALIAKSGAWVGPDNAYGYKRLLDSKSAAARYLPLLLVDQILAVKDAKFEIRVAGLLEEFAGQYAVWRDFREACMPLVLKLLESDLMLAKERAASAFLILAAADNEGAHPRYARMCLAAIRQGAPALLAGLLESPKLRVQEAAIEALGVLMGVDIQYAAHAKETLAENLAAAGLPLVSLYEDTSSESIRHQVAVVLERFTGVKINSAADFDKVKKSCLFRLMPVQSVAAHCVVI